MSERCIRCGRRYDDGLRGEKVIICETCIRKQEGKFSDYIKNGKNRPLIAVNIVISSIGFRRYETMEKFKTDLRQRIKYMAKDLLDIYEKKDYDNLHRQEPEV